MPRLPSAPGNYTFLASNGKQYLLSTFKRTHEDAEAFCQTQGGHLVAYKSASEQRMVEQQYISDNYLLPAFHGAYYIGLVNDGTNWTYTDYFYQSSKYYGWDTRAGWPKASSGSLALANLLTPRNGIFAFNNDDGLTPRIHICVISRERLALPNGRHCFVGSSSSANSRRNYCNCSAMLLLLQTVLTERCPSCGTAPGETQSLAFSTSGGNFTFNNANLTYGDAESDCRAQGGHLASYNALLEQQDVEDFLTSNVGQELRGRGRTRWLMRAKCWARCPSPDSVLDSAAIVSCTPLPPRATLNLCALLTAGHPDPYLPLPPDLLDGPQGCAQVSQLHLAGPHRDSPRASRAWRERLGHQHCGSARACQDGGLWPWAPRSAASQPCCVWLGLRVLHRQHALHLQDVWWAAGQRLGCC
jgi:hypothetical protein